MMEKGEFLKALNDAEEDLREAEKEMFNRLMELLRVYETLEKGMNPEEKQYALKEMVAMLRALNCLVEVLFREGGEKNER